MSTGQSRIDVEKFEGKGFELWKLKVEALLVDRDVWYVIEDEKPSTSEGESTSKSVVDGAEGESQESKELKAWTKDDRKARSLIWLCLADNVLVNVTSEKTAKDLWTKLGSLYQSKSLVNKLFLRRKLYNLRMSEGDSFSAHLNEFNTVCAQLSSIDVNLNDEDKACTLLCSLPNSWEHLIVSIGTGVNNLSCETVVAALLSEEMRRAGSEGTNNEALIARGRNGDKSKSGKRGKSRGRSKSRDKSDTSEIRCWKCKQVGHLRRNCRSKSVGPEKRDDSSSSTSGAKKDDGDNAGDLYMAFDSHSDCNDWIIDTGASFHMTPHREWFCSYEPYSGGTVRMGDDTTHAIVGRGKVRLKMSDGTVKNLPGVMHIPGLTRNLISVGSMADAGVNFSSDRYSCKLTR